LYFRNCPADEEVLLLIPDHYFFTHYLAYLMNSPLVGTKDNNMWNAVSFPGTQDVYSILP